MWTKRRPRKPGRYWFRYGKGGVVFYFVVYRLWGKLECCSVNDAGEYYYRHLNLLTGEWQPVQGPRE